MRKSKYLGELEQQKAILDTYDFEPYLQRYRYLDELMFNFEYEVDNTVLPDNFEGCVFNFISSDEFAEYLANRYPNYIIYEVSRYMITKSKGEENK